MIATLYILMITVFISYMSFILIRYGVQKSISDSYYSLRKDKLGWLFTLYIVGFAYPAAIIASNVWITSAAFLIMLVGVARAFKDSKLLRFLHFFGAYGGVGLCIGGIWVHYNLKCVTIGVIVSFFLIYVFRKYLPLGKTTRKDGAVAKEYSDIFWIEVVVYLAVIYVLHLEL